jgi:hypothetical protein
LSVGAKDVWAILSNNSIKRYDLTANQWSSISSTKGVDVGVGSEGSVFIISDTEASKYHGYTIKKLQSDNTWNTLPISPINPRGIDVDAFGQIWLTDLMGNIFTLYDGEAWIQ